jgi:hypothetical protein
MRRVQDELALATAAAAAKPQQPASGEETA